MTSPTVPSSSPVRSTFVTVVAWVFIILSGLTTLMGALQNIMIRALPFNEMNNAAQDSTLTAVMPAPARIMFSHFQLIFLAFFLLSLLTLGSAIGLLKRLNWARLVFMGMLGIGIAYMVAGLFLQQSMMSSFDAPLRAAATQDSTFRQNAQQLASMVTVIRVVSIVFSLGFAALFGWILVKLASARIRAEFVTQERAA